MNFNIKKEFEMESRAIEIKNPKEDTRKMFAVAVNLEDIESGLITLHQSSILAACRFEAVGRAVEKYLNTGTLIHSYKVTINDGREDISEVLDLLLAGKKIGAIKLYREMSGLGLKEAKEACDRFAMEYNIKRDSNHSW